MSVDYALFGLCLSSNLEPFGSELELPTCSQLVARPLWSISLNLDRLKCTANPGIVKIVSVFCNTRFSSPVSMRSWLGEVRDSGLVTDFFLF